MRTFKEHFVQTAVGFPNFGNFSKCPALKYPLVCPLHPQLFA